MAFGNKLTELRTGLGYSQDELAFSLGVSRQAVSRWEVGTTLPETETLIKISDMFHVSLDYLLKDYCEKNNLDRIVIRFLSSVKDLYTISQTLLDITKDGIVDEQEKSQFTDVVDALDEITALINELKLKINL